MTLTEKSVNKEYRGFSSPNRTTKKILIFGDSGVGKTSLAERFAYSKSTSNYPMTIGVNFMTKRIPIPLDDTQLLLIIDVAGLPKFERIRESFYFGVELFVGVCDLTRKKSLENLEKIWIPEIFRVNMLHNGFKPIIQIVGNKSDLHGLTVITSSDLEAMAYKIGKNYPEITILHPSLIISVNDDHFFNEVFGLKALASSKSCI